MSNDTRVHERDFENDVSSDSVSSPAEGGPTSFLNFGVELGQPLTTFSPADTSAYGLLQSSGIAGDFSRVASSGLGSHQGTPAESWGATVYGTLGLTVYFEGVAVSTPTVGLSYDGRSWAAEACFGGTVGAGYGFQIGEVGVRSGSTPESIRSYSASAQVTAFGAWGVGGQLSVQDAPLMMESRSGSPKVYTPESSFGGSLSVVGGVGVGVSFSDRYCATLNLTSLVDRVRESWQPVRQENPTSFRRIP